MDKIPAEVILGIVYRNRYEKVAGREKGEEDPSSHYRKGKAGDWCNYFTPYHVRVFKEMFPELVTKLGYEESSDWNVPASSK